MKKRFSSRNKVLFFSILLSVLMISSALAADVAYVYKKGFTIDDKVLEVFSDLSLSVDLIPEDELPNDFSSYGLIYVGDEKLADNGQIPIGERASIVSSYFHGGTWGLTDAEGVSQLGATSPLTVIKGDQSIQVYNRAFKRGTIAIPYYFLDENNKAESLVQIASTRETSSGDRFGDVISYALPGAILANGQMVQDETCFFGIIESRYWTPEARELFTECVKFTLSDCQSTSDCPDPFFLGEPFCLGDDIFQEEVAYMCTKDGYAGRCTTYDYDVLLEQCPFACTEGICIACDENPDCDDGIYETEDLCFNPGTTDAVCENLPIACFGGTDCGIDGFIGDLFCTDDITIAQLFETFTCHNPGTGGSYCTSDTTEEQIDTCTDICIDGFCEFFECRTDVDCDDTDSGTEDICMMPGTIDSYCMNYPIICFADTDCGLDGLIDDPFCSTDTIISQLFEAFTCHEPGTGASYCTSETTEEEIETCTDICIDGFCEDIICYSDLDCDDLNPDTEDACHNPGTVDSFCTSEPIACFMDSDCGTDGFPGDPFCSGLDVLQTFETFICYESGTAQSFCDSTLEDLLIEQCLELCVDGQCEIQYP